jgi:hypothetical protein
MPVTARKDATGDAYIWGIRAVDYASEQNRRSCDAGDHSSLGCDSGRGLSAAYASDDGRGTRVLSQNGAPVRFVGDAVNPLMLPVESGSTRC